MLRADFDGDGSGDLVIGVPGEDVGSATDAGTVHVLYGSSGEDLTGAGSSTFSQDTPGVGDEAEAGDRFGSSFAAGRFNDDRYLDLAIGTPYEGLGGRSEAGVVQILFGSSDGLRASGGLLISQGSPGVAGAVEPGDRFGSSLAAADLGGSATEDLAVGVPFEDLGPDADAGAVHVLYGSASGPTGTGSDFVHQDSVGVADTAEDNDRLGSTLAAADLGGSRYADLVVGAPFENLGPAVDAGAVHVLYGATGGPSGAGSVFLGQQAAGVPGASESGDRFGSSLAVADMAGDRFADLAVGVPTEDLGSAADVGGVHVFRGRSGRLSGDGSSFLSQQTPGVPGAAEAGDRFGTALAAADLGRSRYADLAVGVPLEDLYFEGEGQCSRAPGSEFACRDAGAVVVLYGTARGPAAEASEEITQQSLDVAGASERDDRFGASLAAADLGRNAFADLAVGVPDECICIAGPREGGLNLLYGSDDGLASRSSRFYSQQTLGIDGVPETADRFGSVLLAR